MSEFTGYWLCECPQCKTWGITKVQTEPVKTYFYCKRCRKSFRMKHDEVFGLNFRAKGPYTPQEAAKKLKEMTMTVRGW